MILKKSLWAMALVLMLASSCQKEQSAPAVATKTQNNQPQPPPPTNPGPGDPVSFQDFGSLDPRVYGTYGWADFYDATTSMPQPYQIIVDPVTGQVYVLFGFYYMGIQQFDGLGNLIDPFAGEPPAKLEIKWVPCASTGTAEYLFESLGMPAAGTTVTGGVPAPYIFYNTGVTWNHSPGTLKQIYINKQDGQNCYVLKMTVNGTIVYRRVTVP